MKKNEGSGEKDTFTLYQSEIDHHERKKREQKKKRQRRVRLQIFLMAILPFVLLVTAVIVRRYVPSGKRIEPAEYFAGQIAEASADEPVSREEVVSELQGDHLAVVLEDTVDSRTAWMRSGELYLNYEMVREVLNGRMVMDEDSKTLLFTTPLELYEILPDEKTYLVEGEEHESTQEILLVQNGEYYLWAPFLQEHTNVEILPGEAGCHVLIRYRWETVSRAETKHKTVLRSGAGIKYPIVSDLETGTKVTLLEDYGKWYRAVSQDGMIGYVQKKRLSDAVQETDTSAFEEPVYTSVMLDQKVRLVWHGMDTTDGNAYLDHVTEKMTGINVISPTWFFLSDNEGHFTSLADRGYVRKAHRKGLQVWGLVSNFSSQISTYEILRSRAARKTLEESLLAEALECEMDGINVDLEAITEDSAPGYLQFMRELSILCRRNQLILSVDVPVPMPFNLYYDRKELGTVADYVIVMGYDEHYYGSEAGTVASLAFEENGITASLEEVPKEKLVSGIPFYTRVWYTWTNEDGSEGVESEVIPMYKVNAYTEGRDVEKVWDESASQYLVSWTDSDGTYCRIWVEDEESLSLKAELINRYELGGFAAWSLTDEKDSVWALLEEIVQG